MRWMNWRKGMVGICLLMAALFLGGTFACAQEAEDISDQCTFVAKSKYKSSRLHDGAYTTYWTSHKMQNAYLEIKTPQTQSAYGLYICFGEMPAAWEIQHLDAQGQWVRLYAGDTRYMHAYVPLSGADHVRLVDTSGKSTELKINELAVLGQGEIPDWVQRWEPTPQKADLLLLAAHPDDEILYFGGTIPTYAAEQGMNVVVAYMTYSNTTRRSELLNGLWHMGLRTYPVIGTFHDSYAKSLEEAYKKWRKSDVRTFVTALIRRYQPEVMITHDVRGEYGHGAHRLCADAALTCVQSAMDGTFCPESFEPYGGWQVKKLYLHLYEDNALTMDWRIPLSSMGGKTALELAQEAYAMHVTQQSTRFAVEDSGKTSCAAFGLAYSQVGADVQGGDFFENLRQGE